MCQIIQKAHKYGKNSISSYVWKKLSNVWRHRKMSQRLCNIESVWKSSYRAAKLNTSSVTDGFKFMKCAWIFKIASNYKMLHSLAVGIIIGGICPFLKVGSTVTYSDWEVIQTGLEGPGVTGVGSGDFVVLRESLCFMLLRWLHHRTDAD